ncbi:MAG TPA: ABC transporter permease subunit [Trueperaceae bacterium]
MVERTPLLRFLAHLILIVGVVITLFPLWVAFVASTHPIENLISGPFPLLPGNQLVENYSKVLFQGGSSFGRIPATTMMLNSLIMAVGITVGKLVVSFLAAFAIVYFRFPGRNIFFFLIFITLMLPVEVRIVPTYDVVSNVFGPFQALLEATRIDRLLEAVAGIEVDLEWRLLNTYMGLILPIIASATATFLFRQFFQTVPDELVDAARIDGAGPMQFMTRILLPLSRTNIAALSVILFIFGWNQYLWPLLVAQENRLLTVVVGIQRYVNAADSLPVWHEAMALTVLAMLPPVIVVLLLQRLFLKALIDTDK